MVAWERQIEERSVPAWRSRYVAYRRLKRQLDRVTAGAGAREGTPLPRAVSDDEQQLSHCARLDSTAHEGGDQLLGTRDRARQEADQFLEEVRRELARVSLWYEEMVTALESEVRAARGDAEPAGGRGLADLSHRASLEYLGELHLRAVRLTEFAILNSEALRKIVKKMDKRCGTGYQGDFVKGDLGQSPLADPGAGCTFTGERARARRRSVEALVSAERLAELRSQAIATGAGAGLSRLAFRLWRALASAALALAATCLADGLQSLNHEPRARRCVALVVLTVSMWVSEAAPFEATALLVPPLAVLLGVTEGSREEQAKRLVGSVFSDSMYLILCGFVISSALSNCQLDCRAAAALQRSLGGRPFCFMLSIMLLGVGLSALVSNVTAPLLLLEVLKPLLRDLPTDSRYSRALLLGLAFSCNVGGMMTPISSPQNLAALQALRQQGHDIAWGQWLAVSVPFCTLAVVLAWALLTVVYHFDQSAEERESDESECDGRRKALRIPPVVYEHASFTVTKALTLLGAFATLGAFACAPVLELLGGAASMSVLAVAIALFTGTVSRTTFNSYSWHLLFLIGGGSALGLAVRDSGLLAVLTRAARAGLASSPWLLVAELVAIIVATTTFVSHTVAALVLMPLVAELGESVGEAALTVLLGALACSAACALPMTSFPNVNSLLAVDDQGKPWLSVKHFLVAGFPMTLLTAALIVTYGHWLASAAILVE